MKRQLLRYVSGIIPAIVLFTSVQAQISEPLLKFSYKEPAFYDEDPGTPAAVKNLLPGLNINAVKDFNKKFLNAENVNWYIIKDGFVAQFKENGKNTRSLYDTKGKWTGTICTYSANKLPAEIRKRVKCIYYDYSIYIVNEVTIGNTTAYLVGIEDDESIKTIRVIDDEMDVYQNFNKAESPAP